MTHIDLFSGIGGFALAAQWAGFTTVAFVEIEPYAQQILKQNFGAVADAGCSVSSSSRNGNDEWRTGAFTTSSKPILYGDIRTFDGTHYQGATLLTGGFPCQPFSQAGKRRGKDDDRALWPEMFRVIREARPAWVVGENVAGFVTMELDNCISDLEREGYAVQSLVIPACAVDAQHRRDRVWIVGHAEDGGIRRGEAPGSSGQPAQSGEDVAHASSKIGQRRRDAESRTREEATTSGIWPELGRCDSGGSAEGSRWAIEPQVGRVANGIPRRVDRLKGLGNAIVPQVAYEILNVIAEIESR